MSGGLRTLLFPPRCAACGELLRFSGLGQTEPPALCPDCAKQWEREKTLHTCGGCGRPVSECTCMTDVLARAHCSGFYKLVYYRHGSRTPVQNRVLYRIKNAPHRRATAFLAGELAHLTRAMLQAQGIGSAQAVLVPIPRSRRAALRFGTDQAVELAAALSVRTGVPCCTAVRRRVGGKPQKSLDRAARIQHAKQAYRLRPSAEPDLRGRAVLLLDDIVTTGASMAAVARLLRKAGAGPVFCLAVASDDCNQTCSLRQPTFRI